MKKIIAGVILFSMLLSSCNRISPSNNNLSPSPTIENEEAGEADNNYAVLPNSSTETPSASASPTPTAIQDPEETNKPIPTDSSNLNLITPEEAKYLLYNTTDKDIYINQNNKFDEETGFLIVEFSTKNIDKTGFCYVNLRNGDVYGDNDLLILNLLNDISVFDIMMSLGIESLDAYDASHLKAYLFRRVYKEMNSGRWCIDEYIELIEAKKPTEGTADTYSFYYDEEKRRYVCAFIPAFGGGVPLYFDRVTIIDNKNFLTLFNGDESCNIAFEASDVVINKLTYENKDFMRIYKNIADIDDFINASMLLGVYKDAKGNVYEFTSDRKAIWPEGTFYYRLIDQFTYIGCSPFLFSGGTYGFQWLEDKLYFYEIEDSPPNEYTRAEEPFLVLEK